jgi:GSH-dependent disulfide-bond oxidoreductase
VSLRHSDAPKNFSEETAVIQFYFHPTPNPAKIALFLEETGLPYEVIPVDTSKGEQHAAQFRAVNPNGKVPAIIDTAGAGGKPIRVFDSSAILLYLGEKTRRFIGSDADRGELLSWLFFIGTGLGPFSGQAVHFQRSAPEVNAYAINRYRREVERHYEVLDKHLAGHDYILGHEYSIADMSAWGWLDRVRFVLPGSDDPLGAFPHLKRLFAVVDARPAAQRARAVGRDHPFKREVDEETRRALFPSNYPPIPLPN